MKMRVLQSSKMKGGTLPGVQVEAVRLRVGEFTGLRSAHAAASQEISAEPRPFSVPPAWWENHIRGGVSTFSKSYNPSPE